MCFQILETAGAEVERSLDELKEERRAHSAMPMHPTLNMWKGRKEHQAEGYNS
jgi:hypothetical protein